MSTTLKSHEHQFETRRYLSFGVTARNFGTRPASITSSILRVFVSIR